MSGNYQFFSPSSCFPKWDYTSYVRLWLLFSLRYHGDMKRRSGFCFLFLLFFLFVSSSILLQEGNHFNSRRNITNRIPNCYWECNRSHRYCAVTILHKRIFVLVCLLPLVLPILFCDFFFLFLSFRSIDGGCVCVCVNIVHLQKQQIYTYN